MCSNELERLRSARVRCFRECGIVSDRCCSQRAASGSVLRRLPNHIQRNARSQRHRSPAVRRTECMPHAPQRINLGSNAGPRVRRRFGSGSRGESGYRVSVGTVASVQVQFCMVLRHQQRSGTRMTSLCHAWVSLPHQMRIIAEGSWRSGKGVSEIRSLEYIPWGVCVRARVRVQR